MSTCRYTLMSSSLYRLYWNTGKDQLTMMTGAIVSCYRYLLRIKKTAMTTHIDTATLCILFDPFSLYPHPFCDHLFPLESSGRKKNQVRAKTPRKARRRPYGVQSYHPNISPQCKLGMRFSTWS